MREIKFRAWLDEEKGFDNSCYVKPASLQEMIFSKQSSFSLKQLYNMCIFEQYTGIKDNNGKEIYEGDIIQYFGANKRVKVKKEFGIVVFKADRYGAEFTSIIQNKEHEFGGISPEQDIVIGNIHQNVDLLEAENEN